MFSDNVTVIYLAIKTNKKRTHPKPNAHTWKKPRERDVHKLLYLNFRKVIRIFCNVNSWTGGYQRLLSSLSKKKRSSLNNRNASNAFSNSVWKKGCT